MRRWEFHYKWQWQLRSGPEALWPFISDTQRVNYDTGIPVFEKRSGDGPPPINARPRVRVFMYGQPVAWEEEPFEWVRPQRYGVVRRYTQGPVAEIHTLADLRPLPDGGTHLTYETRAWPKNLLGVIAIPIQIGWLLARRLHAALRRYDELAASRQSALGVRAYVKFAPGGRDRLASLRDDLAARGAAPDLVARLIDVVEHADDLNVNRMRPYALADVWGAPRRAVLELCLLATRAGLLSLQWHVLCPLCRGSRQSGASLRDIQEQAHCDSCNIDFTANFDRSVELTFHPNPAVRPVELGEFCVGGPQLTPHIVLQQLLPLGTQRALNLPLEEGRYRARTLGVSGSQLISAAAAGAPQATLRASDEGWPEGELSLATRVDLRLENATPREQLFVLERTAWSDQAATAAEVTSLQVFRDLFANEALRPGERISVGSLTILFTDLRDSTRLYRESGDAVAFGRVMNHFDVLRKAIADQDGALVKTIGDAVMAVFRRPVAAVCAVLNAEKALAAHPSEGLRSLRLKAGIHTGPCVAVTLNDRLDYFGSTVNIASRLEGLSAMREGVVVSAAVRRDPEVEAWLASGGLRAEPFEAMLKGLEGERFDLWAVMPAGDTA